MVYGSTHDKVILLARTVSKSPLADSRKKVLWNLHRNRFTSMQILVSYVILISFLTLLFSSTLNLCMSMFVIDLIICRLQSLARQTSLNRNSLSNTICWPMWKWWKVTFLVFLNTLLSIHIVLSIAGINLDIEFQCLSLPNDVI